ncbi:MAG: hypothetical protein JNK82_26100 [Myxococcaceae bacterium]|nr:hypothetical protein [Myxococcaceae bacterium]
MTLLTAWAYLTLAAAPEPRAQALVVPYQSLGVDVSTVSSLSEGLRQSVESMKLDVLPPSVSDTVARSATMCGEDSACLSTIGQRSGVRYVLAFGVGKVGASLLVSALFVDVKTGQELGRSQRRVPEAMPEWSLVARSLADEVVKLPVEPVVVQVPVEVSKPVKPHTFRPWAFVTLGIAAAMGIVSATIGLVAWGNYANLQKSPGDTRLRETQPALNFSADICLVLSALTGAGSIIFFILDGNEKPVAVTE